MTPSPSSSSSSAPSGGKSCCSSTEDRRCTWRLRSFWCVSINTRPRQLPSGGDVVLDAFKFEEFGTYRLQIKQDESQLTVRSPDFPDDPAFAGTVNQNGNARFGGVLEFTETARQGNRVFRVALTEDWKLQREDGGNRLRGTASFVNVFREGQSSEVFTTCSGGATPTLTRIGG